MAGHDEAMRGAKLDLSVYTARLDEPGRSPAMTKRGPLPQLVMAALEAAIQPIHAGAAWLRVWMAGHDEAMRVGQTQPVNIHGALDGRVEARP